MVRVSVPPWRRTRGRVVGVLLAIVTAIPSVVPTQADEVVSKSGKLFLGQILEESDTVVVILCQGGLRAFPRHQVAQIRHGRILPPRGRSLRLAGNAQKRTDVRGAILKSNRKIQLVSTESVSANDRFTRTALSQFFSATCDPPLELVGGRDTGGEKERPADERAGSEKTTGPGSTPSSSSGAEFRIRIESVITLGKSVRFYGIEIGREADCRLTFVMEHVSESGTRVLLQGGPLSYSLMGGAGPDTSKSGGSKNTRSMGIKTRAYRGAVGGLLTALKTNPHTAAIFGIELEEDGVNTSTEEKKSGTSR